MRLEAENLKRQGYRLGYRAADVTDAKAIARIVEETKTEIGQINALINNAGVNVFSEPLETTDEDWNRCFDIHLKGAWNCCKAVLPGLITQGGVVVLNIASTHSFTIIPHTFPYPLAKHALLGMTKSLGLEVAAKNVRVTDLSAKLASVGDRDVAFPLPHGRGDEFHCGSPVSDPRGFPNGQRPRDIVEPCLHLDTIKAKTRDFR